MHDQIKVEILDKDLVTSDLVGSTLLHVDDLAVNGGMQQQWHEIYYKNKSSGKILISSQFVENANQASQKFEESKEPGLVKQKTIP